MMNFELSLSSFFLGVFFPPLLSSRAVFDLGSLSGKPAGAPRGARSWTCLRSSPSEGLVSLIPSLGKFLKCSWIQGIRADCPVCLLPTLQVF